MLVDGQRLIKRWNHGGRGYGQASSPLLSVLRSRRPRHYETKQTKCDYFGPTNEQLPTSDERSQSSARELSK